MSLVYALCDQFYLKIFSWVVYALSHGHMIIHMCTIPFCKHPYNVDRCKAMSEMTPSCMILNNNDSDLQYSLSTLSIHIHCRIYSISFLIQYFLYITFIVLRKMCVMSLVYALCDQFYLKIFSLGCLCTFSWPHG